MKLGGGRGAQQSAALPCGDEVLQPKVGDERGQDDGERRGKAFENVVGVLDHGRNHQTAHRLEEDDEQAGNRSMKKIKLSSKKEYFSPQL